MEEESWAAGVVVSVEKQPCATVKADNAEAGDVAQPETEEVQEENQKAEAGTQMEEEEVSVEKAEEPIRKSTKV